MKSLLSVKAAGAAGALGEGGASRWLGVLGEGGAVALATEMTGRSVPACALCGCACACELHEILRKINESTQTAVLRLKRWGAVITA